MEKPKFKTLPEIFLAASLQGTLASEVRTKHFETFQLKHFLLSLRGRDPRVLLQGLRRSCQSRRIRLFSSNSLRICISRDSCNSAAGWASASISKQRCCSNVYAYLAADAEKPDLHVGCLALEQEWQVLMSKWEAYYQRYTGLTIAFLRISSLLLLRVIRTSYLRWKSVRHSDPKNLTFQHFDKSSD